MPKIAVDKYQNKIVTCTHRNFKLKLVMKPQYTKFYEAKVCDTILNSTLLALPL